MRRKIVCWVITALVFLFAAASYSQSEKVFKLSGNITNKVDQKPIVGAYITLVGLPQSTSTDQNGNFYLYVEKVTSVTMKVSKGGFKPFTLEVTLPVARPLEIMLEPENPESRPKVIWQIGNNDGRFHEFNNLRDRDEWPWKYEVRQSAIFFPQEINDFARSEIQISFQLEGQANKDLILTLATVSGHGPDFSIQVELQNTAKRDTLGTFAFNTRSRDKKDVKIKSSSTIAGNNTIILVCASPPQTDRWLFWDYLLLSE